MSARDPFLALPPFPKRKIERFELSGNASAPDDAELDHLIDQLARERVGGTWWGAQPDLGVEGYKLARVAGADDVDDRSDRLLGWTDDGTGDIGGLCDPWHVLGGASELRCAADDPMQLIAGIAGVPVRIAGSSGAAKPIDRPRLRAMLREGLGPRLYRSPFTGEPMSWADVIALCGQWRSLIDANRPIVAAYGFAGWKRVTTEPLLWDGSTANRFDRPAKVLRAGDKVAVWKSRTSPTQLARLEHAGAVTVEVEDGFIRSVGLGANCVPPQSIVVDSTGVHFDARSPSGLEDILQWGTFDDALVARAARLRERINALGLSKYDRGQVELARRNDRLHVLVPGQVEDDRAVLSSIGAPLSNLELLRRVRAARPEAHLIYKPHPDVEAGHRKGAIPDAAALALADEVVRAPSISSWIGLVDEVHVNSSLAGFEALLRHRRVTTYGVPFYAGWGLTDDLGPVPGRRSARRSLDELVAATLIVYPRYVDPVTNLPCSPEVMIAQLAALGPADAGAASPLTRLRALQGRIRRLFATVVRHS